MMIAFALNHTIAFQKILKMIKKHMRRNASKAVQSAIIQRLVLNAKEGTIKTKKIIVLNAIRNARLAQNHTIVYSANPITAGRIRLVQGE